MSRAKIDATTERNARQRLSLLVASIVLCGCAMMLTLIAPAARRPMGMVMIPRHRVDLATANAQELALLPNIGPALAARIVEYRSTHGGMLSLRNFDEVEGIGSATIAAIEDEVRGEDIDSGFASGTKGVEKPVAPTR